MYFGAQEILEEILILDLPKYTPNGLVIILLKDTITISVILYIFSKIQKIYR